jgi:hypothetical protein
MRGSTEWESLETREGGQNARRPARVVTRATEARVLVEAGEE